MVFEKVRTLICEQLDIDENKVTEDSAMIEDLGADSLDVVDLIMSIEEEFDITIPETSTEDIKTVGDIVKYIESVI